MALALALSTLAFVAAHFPGRGIPLTQAVGGLVFAVSYEKEKNLLVPFTIHSLGNLAIFSLSLLPALWNRDVVSLLIALIIRRFKRF